MGGHDHPRAGVGQRPEGRNAGPDPAVVSDGLRANRPVERDVQVGSDEDAFAGDLAEALGAPVREVWPEIWSEIGPLFDHVFATGESTWTKDGLLVIDLVREVPEAMKPKKIAIGGDKPLSIVENEPADKAA